MICQRRRENGLKLALLKSHAYPNHMLPGRRCGHGYPIDHIHFPARTYLEESKCPLNSYHYLPQMIENLSSFPTTRFPRFPKSDRLLGKPVRC